MLTLDSHFQKYLEEKQIEKIKIFLIQAGCSGKKINIVFDDFDETDLEKIQTKNGLTIYVKPEEKNFFQSATIRRTVKADHSGEEKVRYLFVSPEVQERCGCGSSFDFEKKQPKLNLSKLADMKKIFS